MVSVDVLIIGSGIAGASAAFELAGEAKVMVVEREDQHGYHTTGRSAALYTEAYGNETIRRLTGGSRAFFDAPPPSFADYPILTPRGCLYLGAPGQDAVLATLLADIRATDVVAETIDAADVLKRVPILRPERVGGGVYEPDACDIDVDALHNGFLRGAKARGADIRLSAEVTAIERAGSAWTVRLSDGETVQTAVVVNAAGAWADQLAEKAGVAPVGLSPLRRTAILLEAPPGQEIAGWPALLDALDEFYFKPEAGRLLASPADETPSEPCDAYPDEMDIAICVDRIQTAADLAVRRVLKSWAGLRTFAPDRTPVIGFDPKAEGFFWLAGQGGYGVQTAPAAGRVAAALALGREAPADLAERGVTAAALSPARF